MPMNTQCKCEQRHPISGCNHVAIPANRSCPGSSNKGFFWFDGGDKIPSVYQRNRSALAFGSSTPL